MPTGQLLRRTVSRGDIDRLESVMRDGIRDVIKHVNTGQANQNERMDKMDERFNSMDERFDTVDVKLDAIMAMLAMRKELHNLVRVLQKEGVKVSDAEVFVS